MCVLEVMYLCVRGVGFVCQRSYMCVRGHVCVLEVMYMCVRCHVFVCQRSCICVLEVMHLCVSFVCQRSCICVLEVMYLCVRGHVFVCYQYWFPLFLQYFYQILELFLHCGIFCFFIFFTKMSNVYDQLILNYFHSLMYVRCISYDFFFILRVVALTNVADFCQILYNI